MKVGIIPNTDGEMHKKGGIKPIVLEIPDRFIMVDRLVEIVAQAVADTFGASARVRIDGERAYKLSPNITVVDVVYQKKEGE